jgi:hypothetical protein
LDPRVFGGVFVDEDDMTKLIAGEDLDNNLIERWMEDIERLTDDVDMRGTRDLCER